jgi:putative acetyltransferase
LLTIAEETAEQAEVAALLAQSDAYSAARYPPRSCHLVGLETLTAAGVRCFVARDAARALGCGALVPHGDGTAELKRMVVDEAARGRGIGRALLAAIETAARAAGVRAAAGSGHPLARGAGAVSRGRLRRARALWRLCDRSADHLHGKTAARHRISKTRALPSTRQRPAAFGNH